MPPKNSHRWDKLSEMNGRVLWYCKRCGCKVDAPAGNKPSALVSNRVVNGVKVRARKQLPTCLADDGQHAERQRRTVLRHSWQKGSPVELDGRVWGGWSCGTCSMEMVTTSQDSYAGAARRYRLSSSSEWVVATGMPIPQCQERPDVKLMREHYVKSGSAYCADALGKTRRWVIAFARRLGLRQPRPERMAEHHLSYLQFKWGVDSAQSIAKATGYDVSVVVSEAKRLGLGGICQRGWEYLTTASKRTGFAITVLRRILKRAFVKPKVVNVGSSRRYLVEIDRVDQAVEDWFRLDNPGSFASRHCMELWQVEEWLGRIGVTRPKGVSPRQWMVHSSELERALKMRNESESVGLFARRHGLSQAQMDGYLLALGHKRPSPKSNQQWRLPVAVMEQVLRDYPRLEYPTSWAVRNGLSVAVVLRELRLAGFKPVRDGGRFRLMPEVMAGVMAVAEKRKEEQARDYMTPGSYALANGHSPIWLRGMLVAAGHTPPPKGAVWKLPRSVIELAVSDNKALTTPTAFSRKTGCPVETLKIALYAAGHKPPRSSKTPWRLPVSAFEAALASAGL